MCPKNRMECNVHSKVYNCIILACKGCGYEYEHVVGNIVHKTQKRKEIVLPTTTRVYWTNIDC